MAGDWIKVEHVTPDKPEVIRMASILGIEQDEVVGKLVRIWIWADQQSVNGNATSVTFAFLDRFTMRTGFAQAMVEVGWLEVAEGGLCLPHFDRHNGQTAKTRALTNYRVKRLRNGESVTKALPEKRREEKSTTAVHTPSGTSRAREGCANGLSDIFDFRRRLESAFRRPASHRWSYAEETALIEVMHSRDYSTELDELLAYRGSLPEDKKRFFPQSLAALLERWGPTLDRARSGIREKPKSITDKILKEIQNMPEE